MKACSVCGRLAPLDEFPATSSGASSSYCRSCHRERSADRSRRYYERHSARRHRTIRNSQYRTKFGLTIEDVEAMREAQHGRCAICGGSEPAATAHDPQRKRALAVDHDAETGQIRALLCSRCNRALGMFGHSAERLRAAAEYLEHHAAKNLTLAAKAS